MFKKNDRVMVMANTCCSSDKYLKRNKYIGATGKLAHDVNDPGSGFCFDIRFDNQELRDSNAIEGGWLWNKHEVVVLEKDNEDYVR